MAETSNAFAAALAAHDQLVLREAFDACNEESDLTSYDRTTLQRWLEGSVPSRGDFIRRLGERLEDQTIHAAWQELRSRPTRSDLRAVVKGFEGLATEDRDQAFQEIRKVYLSRFSSVRSRFSMQIDLNDDPNHPTQFQLRVSISWVGRIPANAEVLFVNRPTALGDAFDASNCIFREVLAIDSTDLDGLLTEAGDQVLAVTALSGPTQRVTPHVADYLGDGIFRFDNEEINDAQIRLSLTYPFPRGVQNFPIVFGQYQVTGVAEINLKVSSSSVSRPRGFAYLPSGQRRNWAVESLRPDELVVYAGKPDAVLSEGDGVVLSWVETPSS